MLNQKDYPDSTRNHMREAFHRRCPAGCLLAGRALARRACTDKPCESKRLGRKSIGQCGGGSAARTLA
eukprot:15247585-Alexandrium_andersonii.AAC.1